MGLLIRFAILLLALGAAAVLGYAAWLHNHMGFGALCVLMVLVSAGVAEDVVQACDRADRGQRAGK